MSKLVLFIATSSDGFIADVDGGVDWLPQPKNDAELEEVGYKDLMGRISTIVMGRKSYDQIVSFGDWAWPDKQTYVFSAEPIPSLATYITSTNEKPEGFCLNIADKEHRGDIWLLGGAKLAKSFNEKRRSFYTQTVCGSIKTDRKQCCNWHKSCLKDCFGQF